MEDDEIDKVAASLSTVKAGGSLDELAVADVTDEGHEVTVVLELPSGDEVSQTFSKPPVWGSNCDLKTLLDAFGLGPDRTDELVGETVPCKREVTGTSMSFEIDLAELADRG